MSSIFSRSLALKITETTTAMAAVMKKLVIEN
jgi:hypothetical protein